MCQELGWIIMYIIIIYSKLYDFMISQECLPKWCNNYKWTITTKCDTPPYTKMRYLIWCLIYGVHLARSGWGRKWAVKRTFNSIGPSELIITLTHLMSRPADGYKSQCVFLLEPAHFVPICNDRMHALLPQGERAKVYYTWSFPLP